MSLSAAVWPQF